MTLALKDNAATSVVMGGTRWSDYYTDPRRLAHMRSCSAEYLARKARRFRDRAAAGGTKGLTADQCFAIAEQAQRIAHEKIGAACLACGVSFLSGRVVDGVPVLGAHGRPVYCERCHGRGGDVPAATMRSDR